MIVATVYQNIIQINTKEFPNTLISNKYTLVQSVNVIYSNIQIFKYFSSEYLFGYSFVSFFGYEYIRIFVRVNFLDTNIFEYSFVARF